jgi:oryzin
MPAGLTALVMERKWPAPAAGNTRGVAKGANLIIAKITTGCTGNTNADTWVLAFNWLAVNAPKGTIANLSYAFSNGLYSCSNIFYQPLEDAIRAAYNAGIIAVVAAGNDGCDTANYSPTRIPEAFVVGATDTSRFAYFQDSLLVYLPESIVSRYGANVSTFAPGGAVALINYNGAAWLNWGTSFAAPYMAGMFAVGCQAAGTLCDTMANAGVAYDALRNIGTLGTVVNSDGSALPGGTVSRFISRSPW